ncbi:hypothetical protein ABH920_008637 [Catenulispora sp. EB89]|uniref:Shedu anti-phage system protein SduA domain-containing protein n=1 Tax=Catenulispora sp. EB89 TaxID=3156257 RepID=UPI0035183B87
MPPRSDWTLELQLEIVRKQCVDVRVAAAVDDVIKHMNGGQSRSRRGGKRLTDLLEAARRLAADGDEWHVVRLLQDSLDYAENRILLPDFEERYRLFRDGARSDTSREFLGRMMAASYIFAVDTLRDFVDENPQANFSDFIAHFESMRDDARLLEAPEDQPGRYRLIRGKAEMALWIERKLRDRVDVEDVRDVARRLVATPEALLALAADEDGMLLLRAAELQQRMAKLGELRKLAEDPGASEHDLQQAFEAQPWIFGGQFIGTAARRSLVLGSEVDVPLLRADGSLHIVELKRAMGLASPLVVRQGASFVPAADVHHAVMQAVTYLVGLDENRHQIRAELGIEARRASATVLIGHPALHPEIPEEQINETLRTMNAHVSRVDVRTYKELIDDAERALGGPTANAGREVPSPVFGMNRTFDR